MVLRPTFMGFEAAKSAIFANQKSIDIMGNNLANIDTNGYTRQRVERASVAPSAYSTRVGTSRTALAGQGVDTLGVSQLRDSFLDKRFRDEYAQSSYHSRASSILQDIQSALGDGHDITDESGLYGAIQQLYKNLNDFIQEPTMDTEANIVMSAFKNITQVLQQLNDRLTSVVTQQTGDLQVDVSRVNDITAQIAHLNRAIGEDSSVLTDSREYSQPNELLDQRNLLLDELASYGDLQVTELANGKVNVQMGGHTVIQENHAGVLNMLTNNDGTIALQWGETVEGISTSGGILKASLDFLNGRGHNMQSSTETPFQGVPYYRDQLDTFAGALANMVNHSVPEQDTVTGQPKVDTNGNIVYKTLLAAKTAGGSTSVNVPVTAANITISDEWRTNGAGYFIYSRDEDVEDYAQQIASRLTDTDYTFRAYGESFTGSFADFEVNFLGRLGSDLSYQQSREEATAKVADDFLSRRDAVSGVSRDEETTDMLKYQKSYEAASRMMTVLDDLLDVVINRMGRAGL